MAKQDFSKLLGKRVGYLSKPINNNEPAVYFTGYILGFMQYVDGAEVYDEIIGRGDILFMSDKQPNLMPDFISSNHDFHIIE